MSQSKLPKIDFIEKSAEFWDTHDLTDFEDELEEITEPVFVRGNAIKVRLKSREARAIKHIAQAKGVSPEKLIRSWVLQELARRNNGLK